MSNEERPPTDLKQLSELSITYRIPYQTLRRWQTTGKLGEWQVRGRFMASVAEVEEILRPKKVSAPRL